MKLDIRSLRLTEEGRKKLKELLFFIKYKRAERIWLSVNEGVDLNHHDYKEQISPLSYVPMNSTTEIYKNRLSNLVRLFNSRLIEVTEHDFQFSSILFGISVRKANIIVIKSKPWIQAVEDEGKPCHRFLNSELVSKVSHIAQYTDDHTELFDKTFVVFASHTFPYEHAVRIGTRGTEEEATPIWRCNLNDYPVEVIDNIYNCKNYRTLYPLTLYKTVCNHMRYFDIIPYAVVHDPKTKSIGIAFIFNPVHNWVRLYMQTEFNIRKIPTFTKVVVPIVTGTTNFGVLNKGTLDLSSMKGITEL